MAAYDIPQPVTCGGTWVGIDATPTGTAATNDVVVDFTGCVETLSPLPSFPVPVLAVHDQALGSTFKVQLEGEWIFSARLACQTAAPVALGLGLDNIAAELNTDPLGQINARLLDNELRVATAGSFGGMLVTSDPIIITRAMAKDPALAVLRVLASNAAGAGVAAAALVLNVCYFRARRIGDVPSQLRG